MTPRLKLPLTGDRVSLLPGDGPNQVTIVRRSDEATIGRVTLEVEGDAVTVLELCIDPAERSFGGGSDAARLLVHAAEEAGYERIVASAPPDLGLAVYFWFRMGLRPLHGEGPGGGILLERRLASGAVGQPKQT